MKKLKFAMGACFFCVGFSVLAQNAQAPNDDAAQAALQQRLLDQEVAPIRSQVGLQEYLRFLPAQSPLKALSPAARARFLDSLVFSKNGLASYSYKDLAAELTVLEAYKILALFGQQATVSLIPGLRQSDGFSEAIMSSAGSRAFPNSGGGDGTEESGKDTDYPDYACISRATCKQSIGEICIGSNC